MLSSLTLMTGWTCALAKPQLTRPYIAFDWIPFPIGAVVCFLLGFMWIYVAVNSNEWTARKILWTQAGFWLIVSLHFDPYVQVTAFTTYGLMSGALIGQGLKINYVHSQIEKGS